MEYGRGGMGMPMNRSAVVTFLFLRGSSSRKSREKLGKNGKKLTSRGELAGKMLGPTRPARFGRSSTRCASFEGVTGRTSPPPEQKIGRTKGQPVRRVEVRWK